ncbi:hypothetical protein FRC10_008056 [Ceratobasidium sp. 414]|nr:hypothetical protein FRC10_008056 [Ceratobasidium sp. 414]
MDLTRLELYASFVKRIRTSGQYTINFPDRWKESGQETRPKPLLPNLLHLVIHTRGPARYGEVGWSTVFLGPKLLSFEVFLREYDSKLPAEEDGCSRLVEKISEMCPSLEKLRIYSRNSLIPLSSLNHLRSFTINEHGINNQVLQTLGRLPYLERLALFRDGLDQWAENEDPIELPDDSFPSLRDLSLNSISPFPLAQICTSPKLFRNLVIANISYGADSSLKFRSNLERLNIATCPLGHGSPYITCLAIYLNGWFAPSWSIIEAFKQMPLRRLNLYLVVFGSEGSVASLGEEVPPVYHPTIGWRDFLSAVPLLEEFYLPRQTLEPNHLPIFASMLPRLRLLVLKAISFTGAERVPNTPGWRPTTQAITIQLNWSSMRLFRDVSDVSGVARSVMDNIGNLDS